MTAQPELYYREVPEGSSPGGWPLRRPGWKMRQSSRLPASYSFSMLASSVGKVKSE